MEALSLEALYMFHEPSDMPELELSAAGELCSITEHERIDRILVILTNDQPVGSPTKSVRLGVLRFVDIRLFKCECQVGYVGGDLVA